MTRGDKFSVSATLDVEILGYYPAGEQQDGKAKYVCTINGYKMMAGADFLDNLKSLEIKKEEIKEEKKVEVKKEVKRNGRRKKSS